VTPIASLWDFFLVRAYVLGSLLGIAMMPFVLLSKKSSQSKVAWIFALIGWPWFALLLFLLFGRSRLARKVVRLRQSQGPTLDPMHQRYRRTVSGHRESVPQLTRDLVTEAVATGGAPPYPGNAVDLYGEGREAFEKVGAAVAAAKRHVHVETYIFKSDRTGHEVLDALVHAAKRGVEVRLVFDALGSYGTKGKFFEPLRRAGGRCTSFLPIGASPTQFFRLNLRNHRKIVVIDGHTAFLGGRNVGDEYRDDPTWRDLHGAVRGPAACGIQRVFLEDWHFATGELLDDDCYFDGARVEGDVPVQVLPDGPDTDPYLLEDLFFSAIAGARTRVDLATPYFVPSEPLHAAIRSALGRGRRVRILVGKVIDHRVVRWAGQSFLPELLEAGLEAWEHPGMVHSKVLAVDDEWATFGSTNFDARSLRLNFELNVGVPHRATARRLREYIDSEIEHSRRITMDDVRYGVGGRLLRNAAGLFAPIL
jgi:cardiolipin synthase